MSGRRKLKTLSSDDNFDEGGIEAVNDTLSSDMSDQELLMRMINGEGAHGAFSELVEKHHKRFYAAAYRLLGNRQEAEDIVQECFLKLWRKPSIWKADKKAKFSTWFYQIVLNECRMFWRKKKATTASSFSDDEHFERIVENASQDEHSDFGEQLDKQKRQVQLEQAIQSLPDRQREALTLCFYEALTNKEAAEIMNIKVKALESLLMRGKQKLKELLHR